MECIQGDKKRKNFSKLAKYHLSLQGRSSDLLSNHSDYPCLDIFDGIHDSPFGLGLTPKANHYRFGQILKLFFHFSLQAPLVVVHIFLQLLRNHFLFLLLLNLFLQLNLQRFNLFFTTLTLFLILFNDMLI